MWRVSAALLAAALASGCDTYHFLAGTVHEDARRPVQALRHYESFLAARPRDPRSCEVRLRAAELYRETFDRCGEARRHYEAAARDFPRMTVCAQRAKAGLLTCPDYFPLDRGRTWVYVDSDTKGRAMRLDWELRRSSGVAGGVISATFHAGRKRVREGLEFYAKEDWAVWRVGGSGREAFLRYPYSEGLSWTGTRTDGGTGSRVEWLVVSSSESVAVAAGAFTGCLKVRELDARYPGTWRYDYYCPGVGRVKTSVGGPGFENPNTELLRFGRLD